jgi:hypothetical protein
MFFIGFAGILTAQSKKGALDLATYLDALQKKYDVIFSYANDNIEGITADFQDDLETLQQQLNYLQQQTPFTYVFQGKRSILLIPKASKENVCVSVFDNMTKEPVSSSRLIHAGFTYTSDENGIFLLPKAALGKELKIFKEDYITKVFVLQETKGEDCPSIFINPFYQTLDEVVLTSLLTNGIQKIASGGLEINYEDFGILPGLIEPDVLQSLQALPGIVSRGERVSYLNVRGGTHDQNLFLWDGIKMYNTSHFFGMISAFNPYMTQNVSLVKNGTSSKYGDGVSSLIDMRTSNAIADSLQASVGLNLINIDALIEAPLNEASSVEFSTRQSINSIWESPTYNQYFDKVFQNTEVTNLETPTTQQENDFSFFDAALNYKHQLTEQDYLKANLYYAEDQFELNRFDQEQSPINTRTSDLEQFNIAAGLLYERAWSPSTKSQLQYYISSYSLNAVNTNLLNLQRLEQRNRVNEYGLKLNLETQLTSFMALETGYQFNETGILNSQSINDPAFFEETQNALLTNSVYADFKYSSENKLLNLSLGSRLNLYSKFEEVLFEPRLRLNYQIVRDLFVEVLAEQKSQVTSQTIDLQTDFLGVENRRWVLSAPDTRPIIQSEQVSFGLNFIKPSWFINFDMYYKKVDGITTQSQGFQNQFELAEDHGYYDILGFDFLINKNFRFFSGWLSYSFSENNYSFENLIPSSFPNNLDITHVISTGFSYEKHNLKISTGLNWHSGATTTNPSENQNLLPQTIAYELPNSGRLDDYLRLDFSSTYNFKLSKNINALAGISFLNVLGNSNIYNRFYWLNAQQNIQTFNQNGLGFTPNLLFRVTF